MNETQSRIRAVQRSESFPRSAARASVAAPIIVWVLRQFGAEIAGEDRTAALILVGVYWFLIGIGLALACTALLMMRRRATSGVAAPALCGLLLNLFLIATAIYFATAPSSHSPMPGNSHIESADRSTETWNPSTETWQRFDSVMGRFTAEFPGAAVEKEKVAGSSLGHQCLLTLPDGSAFGVTWIDPPVLLEVTDENARGKLLDSTIQFQIDKGGQVLDRHAVEVAGYSGVELRLKRDGKHGPVVLVQRDAIMGARTYQILAEISAAEQESRSSEINRFLDSFKPAKP